MAYPALTNTIASGRPVGIKRVFARNGDSEKWQSLGEIRNGEFTLMPIETVNTYKWNLSSTAYNFTGKFDLLQTLPIEVEALANLVNGAIDFLLQLTDAGAIPASTGVTEGWIELSNSQVGVHPTFKAEGDINTHQFSEINLVGTIKKADLDACVKADIDDQDFHISSTADETFANNNSLQGGTLFGYYNSTTPADIQGIMNNINPNGVASIALDNVQSSGALTITDFGSSKIILDFQVTPNQNGLPRAFGINADIEIECRSTDSASLLLLDTVNTTYTNFVITMLDGKVFTFTNKLGCTAKFENLGDFDKYRNLRFMAKGNFLVSDLAGIVS